VNKTYIHHSLITNNCKTSTLLVATVFLVKKLIHYQLHQHKTQQYYLMLMVCTNNSCCSMHPCKKTTSISPNVHSYSSIKEKTTLTSNCTPCILNSAFLMPNTWLAVATFAHLPLYTCIYTCYSW
jgi:hypothetical protein